MINLSLSSKIIFNTIKYKDIYIYILNLEKASRVSLLLFFFSFLRESIECKLNDTAITGKAFGSGGERRIKAEM